jgi:hypothetical protein
MNIGGYGSRIALAEPVIGRAFARPVGSLVRDDEIDSIFKQPILRPSLRAKQSIAPRKGRMDCFVALLLLLAMTLNSRCDSAFPRRETPEFC